MLIAIALPIGLTFGAGTWALMRGRGGGTGFLLSVLFGIIGAFVGALAGQAFGGDHGGTPIGLGSVAGALLTSVVQLFGFGPRPKRAAQVDPSGVAVEQPRHGEATKTLI